MHEHQLSKERTIKFPKLLNHNCQRAIADAAAMAVAIDPRALSFTDSQEGMAQYSEEIFKAR